MNYGKTWGLTVKVNARALSTLTGTTSRLQSATRALREAADGINRTIAAASEGMEAFTKRYAGAVERMTGQKVDRIVKAQTNAAVRTGAVAGPAALFGGSVNLGMNVLPQVLSRTKLNQMFGISGDVYQMYRHPSQAGTWARPNKQGDMSGSQVLSTVMRGVVTGPLSLKFDQVIAAIHGLQQVQGQHEHQRAAATPIALTHPNTERALADAVQEPGKVIRHARPEAAQVLAQSQAGSNPTRGPPIIPTIAQRDARTLQLVGEYARNVRGLSQAMVSGTRQEHIDAIRGHIRGTPIDPTKSGLTARQARDLQSHIIDQLWRLTDPKQEQPVDTRVASLIAHGVQQATRQGFVAQAVSKLRREKPDINDKTLATNVIRMFGGNPYDPTSGVGEAKIAFASMARIANAGGGSYKAGSIHALSRAVGLLNRHQQLYEPGVFTKRDGTAVHYDRIASSFFRLPETITGPFTFHQPRDRSAAGKPISLESVMNRSWAPAGKVDFAGQVDKIREGYVADLAKLLGGGVARPELIAQINRQSPGQLARTVRTLLSKTTLGVKEASVNQTALKDISGRAISGINQALSEAGYQVPEADLDRYFGKKTLRQVGRLQKTFQMAAGEDLVGKGQGPLYDEYQRYLTLAGGTYNTGKMTRPQILSAGGQAMNLLFAHQAAKEFARPDSRIVRNERGETDAKSIRDWGGAFLTNNFEEIKGFAPYLGLSLSGLKRRLGRSENTAQIRDILENQSPFATEAAPAGVAQAAISAAPASLRALLTTISGATTRSANSLDRLVAVANKLEGVLARPLQESRKSKADPEERAANAKDKADRKAAAAAAAAERTALSQQAEKAKSEPKVSPDKIVGQPAETQAPVPVAALTPQQRLDQIKARLRALAPEVEASISDPRERAAFKKHGVDRAFERAAEANADPEQQYLALANTHDLLLRQVRRYQRQADPRATEELLGLNLVATSAPSASRSARSFSRQYLEEGDSQARLGKHMGRVAMWGASGGLVYGATTGIRDAISTMANFEKELVGVERVINPIGTSMGHMADKARDMAEKYGHGLVETVQGMQIFAQQGRDMSDILRQTEVAMLATNVTELGLVEATEALTAAQKQFQLSATNSMRILDSWNEVENTTSVTTRVLVDAMKRSGTAAQEAGIDFDMFNGIVAAIGEATRKTGDEIGTSLKFMFQRLYGTNVAASLEKIGIAVSDTSGKFKSAKTILNDVAGRWRSLTDVQRNQIAVSVAGTRHVNDFLVLMEHYDRAIDVSTTSLLSYGSATRENEIAMKTLSKQVEQLKASWQGLLSEFANAGALDMLKAAVSVLRSGAQALGALNKGTGNLFGGALSTLLLAGGTVATASFLGVNHLPGAVGGLFSSNRKFAPTTQVMQGQQAASRTAAPYASYAATQASVTAAAAAAAVAAPGTVLRPATGAQAPTVPALVPIMPVDRAREIRQGRLARVRQGRWSQRLGSYGNQITGVGLMAASSMLGSMVGDQTGEEPTGWTTARDIGLHGLQDTGLAMMLARTGTKPWQFGRQGTMGKITIGVTILSFASQAYSALEKLWSKTDPAGRLNSDKALQDARSVNDKVMQAQATLRDFQQGMFLNRENVDISGVAQTRDVIAALAPQAVGGSMEQWGQSLSDASQGLETGITTIHKQLAAMLLESPSTREALDKFDKLYREMDALPADDRQQRIAKLSQITESRDELGQMVLNPLKAMALQGGHTGTGLGLDTATLARLARQLRIPEDDFFREMINNTLTGRTGQTVNVRKMLQDAGLSPRHAYDQGVVQITPEGPLKTIKDLKDATPGPGQTVLRLGDQAMGKMFTPPENIERLVNEYGDVVNKLIRNNTDLTESMQFVNDVMLKASFATSEMGRVAGGLHRHLSESMGKTLLDIETRGADAFGRPTFDSGRVAGKGLQTGLSEAIGEVMRKAQSGAPVGVKGLTSLLSESALGLEQAGREGVSQMIKAVLESAKGGSGNLNGPAYDSLTGAMNPHQVEQFNNEVLDYANKSESEQERFAKITMARLGTNFRQFSQNLEPIIRHRMTEVVAQVDNAMKALGQEFDYGRLAGKYRNIDQFVAGPGQDTRQQLAGLQKIYTEVAGQLDHSIAQARQSGDTVATDTLVRVRRELGSTLDYLNTGLSRFGQLIYDSNYGLRELKDRIAVSTRLGEMGGLYGQSGTNADRFAMATIDKLVAELQKDETQNADAIQQLLEARRGHEGNITVQQESRQMAQRGLLTSALADGMSHALGIGGKGIQGFLDAMNATLRERFETIASLAAPRLEAAPESERNAFIKDIQTAFLPQLSRMAQLNHAADTGYQMEYLTASFSRRAIADRIESSLNNGGSVDSVMGHWMMRDAANGDPMIRRLLEKNLEQDLLRKALDFHADVLSENNNQLGTLSERIQALTEIFRRYGVPVPQETVKDLAAPLSSKVGTLSLAGTSAVDHEGRIRADETPAVLHKGEIVLNKRQADALTRNRYAKGTLPLDRITAFQQEFDRKYGFSRQTELGGIDVLVREEAIREARQRIINHASRFGSTQKDMEALFNRIKVEYDPAIPAGVGGELRHGRLRSDQLGMEKVPEMGLRLGLGTEEDPLSQAIAKVMSHEQAHLPFGPLKTGSAFHRRIMSMVFDLHDPASVDARLRALSQHVTVNRGGRQVTMPLGDLIAQDPDELFQSTGVRVASEFTAYRSQIAYSRLQDLPEQMKAIRKALDPAMQAMLNAGSVANADVTRASMTSGFNKANYALKAQGVEPATLNSVLPKFWDAYEGLGGQRPGGPLLPDSPSAPNANQLSREDVVRRIDAKLAREARNRAWRQRADRGVPQPVYAWRKGGVPQDFYDAIDTGPRELQRISSAGTPGGPRPSGPGMIRRAWAAFTGAFPGDFYVDDVAYDLADGLPPSRPAIAPQLVKEAFLADRRYQRQTGKPATITHMAKELHKRKATAKLALEEARRTPLGRRVAWLRESEGVGAVVGEVARAGLQAGKTGLSAFGSAWSQAPSYEVPRPWMFPSPATPATPAEPVTVFTPGWRRSGMLNHWYGQAARPLAAGVRTGWDTMKRAGMKAPNAVMMADLAYNLGAAITGKRVGWIDRDVEPLVNPVSQTMSVPWLANWGSATGWTGRLAASPSAFKAIPGRLLNSLAGPLGSILAIREAIQAPSNIMLGMTRVGEMMGMDKRVAADARQTYSSWGEYLDYPFELAKGGLKAIFTGDAQTDALKQRDAVDQGYEALKKIVSGLPGGEKELGAGLYLWKMTDRDRLLEMPRIAYDLALSQQTRELGQRMNSPLFLQAGKKVWERYGLTTATNVAGPNSDAAAREQSLKASLPGDDEKLNAAWEKAHNFRLLVGTVLDSEFGDGFKDRSLDQTPGRLARYRQMYQTAQEYERNLAVRREDSARLLHRLNSAGSLAGTMPLAKAVELGQSLEEGQPDAMSALKRDGADNMFLALVNADGRGYWNRQDPSQQDRIRRAWKLAAQAAPAGTTAYDLLNVMRGEHGEFFKPTDTSGGWFGVMLNSYMTGANDNRDNKAREEWEWIRATMNDPAKAEQMYQFMMERYGHRNINGESQQAAIEMLNQTGAFAGSQLQLGAGNQERDVLGHFDQVSAELQGFWASAKQVRFAPESLGQIEAAIGAFDQQYPGWSKTQTAMASLYAAMGSRLTPLKAAWEGLPVEIREAKAKKHPFKDLESNLLGLDYPGLGRKVGAFGDTLRQGSQWATALAKAVADYKDLQQAQAEFTQTASSREQDQQAETIQGRRARRTGNRRLLYEITKGTFGRQFQDIDEFDRILDGVKPGLGKAYGSYVQLQEGADQANTAAQWRARTDLLNSLPADVDSDVYEGISRLRAKIDKRIHGDPLSGRAVLQWAEGDQGSRSTINVAAPGMRVQWSDGSPSGLSPAINRTEPGMGIEWQDPESLRLLRHGGGRAPGLVGDEFIARKGEIVVTPEFWKGMERQSDALTEALKLNRYGFDSMAVDAGQFMSTQSELNVNGQVEHTGEITLNMGGNVQDLLSQLMSLLQGQTGGVPIKQGDRISSPLMG